MVGIKDVRVVLVTKFESFYTVKKQAGAIQLRCHLKGSCDISRVIWEVSLHALSHLVHIQTTLSLLVRIKANKTKFPQLLKS
jgi:hypothetical protein